MKMKPILFNTEMVRAILEGRKTVMRRVVKPQPVSVITEEERRNRALSGFDPYGFCIGTLDTELLKKAPYHPNDILYVREAFGVYPSGKYCYRADFIGAFGWGWRTSIHMPREAARIFLRVTDVRVERLQDITAENVLDEGIEVKFPEPKPGYVSLAYTEMRLKPAAIKQFADFWNSTIKPTDCALYGWEANPFVWVIEFERITREEVMECDP